MSSFKRKPIIAIPIGDPAGIGPEIVLKVIEKSIQLALGGAVDAVATTPINKEALKAAGVPFIGHTLQGSPA